MGAVGDIVPFAPGYPAQEGNRRVGHENCPQYKEDKQRSRVLPTRR